MRGGPSVGRLDAFQQRAIEAALTDNTLAMEAVLAFRRGDDSEEADAGAYLIAAALRALIATGGLR